MPAVRILKEVCVAEIREVAFDAEDRPLALRLTRTAEDRRLVVGSRLRGHLRNIALNQGGGFLELEGRYGDAFIRLKGDHGFSEGQAIDVAVVAESRREGKLPRVVLAKEFSGLQALDFWNSTSVDQVPPGDPDVATAFESALSDNVSLPGGGNLFIERTRALIAADIDTAGRREAGRPASQALNVNLDAAEELARQIRLRNLGGIVVLDCVGPINHGTGEKIRERFVSVFKRVSGQHCRVLPPSQLGLLQASVAWSETPIAERLLDGNGIKTPESISCDGLRLLEQEAQMRRMDRLCLRLPAQAYIWLQSGGRTLMQAMSDKYGERFIYESTEQSAPYCS